MTTVTDMTVPQQRMLVEIAIVSVPGGTKVYNGRARRTVEKLEALGLIGSTYDLHPSVGKWTETFSCWATEDGRDLLPMIDYFTAKDRLRLRDLAMQPQPLLMAERNELRKLRRLEKNAHSLQTLLRVKP